MNNSRRVLVRQWGLVRELCGPRRVGLTVKQLIEATGVSRKTVYRDLATLRDAGVPIDSTIVNGEARHRLLTDQELPRLGFTSLQVAALHLARTQLEPLAGTGLVDELDALLVKVRAPEPQQSFRFPERNAGRPEILRTVERALKSRRRVRIEYRAASRGGSPTSVHIEPLVFSFADRQPYVRAYCVERDAERTYKLDRIERAEFTSDPATYGRDGRAENAFEHAVKAWTGSPTRVKVKLDRSVAWRADEYRLVPEQKIERRRDGAAVVEARVAGIVETSSWVLAWGGAAEALEPPALRELVQKELGKALSKYQRPGPAKAHRRKSTARLSSRVTRGGTRGA